MTQASPSLFALLLAGLGLASPALSAPVRGVVGDLWADRVLGQVDFSETTTNKPSNRHVYNPGGVLVDRSGYPGQPNRLYVYDANNNRVLGFSDIANAATLGSSSSAVPIGADIVLGQSDFSRSSCNGDSAYQNYPSLPFASASCLCSLPPFAFSPWETRTRAGMATDAAGNLFVPDFWNNRVLRYERSSLVAGGPFPIAASQVWGQGSMTAHSPNMGGSRSNATLYFGGTNIYLQEYQAGVDIDAWGNMWVTDVNNHRVLRFPAGINGYPQYIADVVFGQGGSFTAGLQGFSQTDLLHLSWPVAVKVDSAGNVYVLDNPPNVGGSWSNPSNANLRGRLLLYQPTGMSGGIPTYNMTAGAAASMTDYLGTPQGLDLDPAGGLWVSDFATGQVVLLPVTPGLPANFTPPSKVLLKASPQVLQGGPLPSSGDGTPPNLFQYQYGGAMNNYTKNAGPISVASDGSVFVCSTGDPLAVWRFPAPIPAVGSLPAGRAHSADWDVFHPRTRGEHNESSLSSFRVAQGLAVYEGGGSSQVIVADTDRLMYWNLGPSGPSALANGQDADGVAATSQPFFYNTPYQFSRIREDQAGHLWTLRRGGDNRVEAFALPLTSGQSAMAVLTSPLPLLGGGSFSWNGPNFGRRLDGVAPEPNGLAIWLSDEQNSRVFRVRNPLTSPQVDIVIGQASLGGTTCNQGGTVQPGFACSSTVPSASTLNQPGAVDLDPAGNLYVGDHSLEYFGNRRVLRYNAATLAAALASANLSGSAVFGVVADGVFGTGGSFSLSGCVAPPFGLCAPWGSAFSPDNSMMVTGVDSQSSSSRFPNVMINPHLGETLSQPLRDYGAQTYSLAFDSSSNLYVADFNWNRVMIYLQPTPELLGPTLTRTPSWTPSPIFSPTPSRTQSPSPSATPSRTPSPIFSPTPSRTESSSPSATPSKTESPVLSPTPSRTQSATPGPCCSAAWNQPNATLSAARGLAIDSAGGIGYVADNNSVRTFDLGSGALTGIVGAGNQFGSPQGIALGADGNLYVANYSAGTFQKVVPGTGAVLATVGGGEGLGNIRGIWADTNGDVYLTSQNTTSFLYRYAYTAPNTYTKLTVTVGGTVLNTPTGIAKVGPRIFVNDGANSRTQMYQESVPGSGNYDQATTLAAGSFAQAGGQELSADSFGNIYVTSFSNSGFKVYGPDGTFLYGCLNGSLDNPFGIAADDAGNVYIGAATNNHVMRINGCLLPTATPSPTPTPSASPSGTATATPSATETATQTATETATPSATGTGTGTATETATEAATGTASPTATDSETPSPTQSPMDTPTASFTATELPSQSPSPTPSPSLTSTPGQPAPSGIYIGLPYPNPAGPGGTDIPITVPGPASVEVRVYSVAFTQVRSWTQSLPASGSIHWDLKNNSGGPVARGIYFVVVKVQSQGQSASRVLKVAVLR